MSTLQNQITQSLEGLSDDSLRFILEMIQRFVMPAESKGMYINHDIAIQKKKRRIGSMSCIMESLFLYYFFRYLFCIPFTGGHITQILLFLNASTCYN